VIDAELTLREVRDVLLRGLHTDPKRPTRRLSGADKMDGDVKHHGPGPGHAELHNLTWDALDIIDAALESEKA